MATNLLTKEQILAASDRKQITVEVPSWGGSVTLRRMTALDYWRLNKRGKSLDWSDPVAVLQYSCEYLVRCIVDPESGEPMFAEGDIEALMGKSPEVLDKLFGAALDLHGVTPDSGSETEKNSKTTANCDGGSASHGCADIPIPTTCSPS